MARFDDIGIEFFYCSVMPHTMMGKPWSFCAREGKVCNAIVMVVFVKNNKSRLKIIIFIS